MLFVFADDLPVYGKPCVYCTGPLFSCLIFCIALLWHVAGFSY